jgi:uncharacterized protein (DUF952 family)
MDSNLLGNEYMAIIKQLFNIGTNYFPETIHMIYIIRAPFIFRLAWNIIKYWINPTTGSKIKMINRLPFDDLIKDGFPIESIPKYIGGMHEGTNTFQLITEIIGMCKIDDNSIFKLLTEEQWLIFQESGTFTGNETDIIDGYIHLLSTKAQVYKVIQKYYKNINKVFMLYVDKNIIDNLKYEKTKFGDLYACYYGALLLEHLIHFEEIKNNI